MSRNTFKNEGSVNSATFTMTRARNLFNGTTPGGPVTIVLQNCH
jgi:hypothetical protein